MRISVVTAVYNRADTIARAMASFNSQSWIDREQVVIDGASSDDTLARVQTQATAHTVIRSEPDDGIYDALNKGISLCSGDVIGLLHSDDHFAHDRVLEQVADAFADPQVDIVYADAAFFSRAAPTHQKRRYSSAHFCRDRIGLGWMPAHTTMFARRDVFDRFGLYRTDYRIAADFEFVARCFGSGHITARYIPDVWVMMQTGGASTGGLRAKIVLNREVLRACRENGIETSYAKVLSKYPRKALEYLRK